MKNWGCQVVLLLLVCELASSARLKRITPEELKKRQEAQNLSIFVNNVLKTYDKKLRPNAGGESTDVIVEGKVVAFGELREASMEFSLDIFFRQWWYDPRFAHNFSIPFNMAADATKIFWTPDTYFVNVKNSKYHFVTRENMRVKIDPDGRVYFSTRITLTAQCAMDFRLFPMDTQHCSLVIESYAYTAAEVNYTWKIKEKSNGIEIVSQEMAQFDLLGVKTETKDLPKSTSFASLTATFSFKRRLEFFIFSVFTPAVILVILSWCCFWISRQAVPARVSLGITTILTTILLSSSVNRDMPKVSYMKSIDYFLLTNFGFIFLSFLEYVIVLNSEPAPSWWKKLIERIFSRVNNNDSSDRHLHVQTVDRNGRNRDVATVVLPKDHSKEPSVVVVTTHPNEPATVTRQRKIDLNQVPRAEKPKPENTPGPPPTHWVDLVSRALFPAAYFLFLAIYWISNSSAAENGPKP
ncbi:gamma-aminobutyric acid receptor subunit alpha-6 isoform X2 [Exaiptasia diaphana]|uniref:Gamma-aminobutyric acid receptor subunit beta n=1 Tax=Exaiptasia diaphana TaxID=2652724 RepID=A0A913YM71_EXADI|nr:gamma-aminobutyric acid receptor subunit alpha-6 isoform X2 [Exaiptasia diaphana]